KPGYKPAQVTVTHKVAGAGAAGVAGNVLVGGLIGIGVDTYTGAAMDLVPNPVQLSLEPVDPPPAQIATAPVNESTISPVAIAPARVSVVRFPESNAESEVEVGQSMVSNAKLQVYPTSLSLKAPIGFSSPDRISGEDVHIPEGLYRADSTGPDMVGYAAPQ